MGVILLGFSYFAVIQFLSFECLFGGLPAYPGLVGTFACFLGVDPVFIPYLLGAGASLVLAGFLLDYQARGRTRFAPPPGFGFVVLGAAVLEIASTYLFGAWSVGFSPLTPTLLAGGIGLLAQGAWSWWGFRSERSSNRGAAESAARAVREATSPAPQRDGLRVLSHVAAPLGILVTAFGFLALVIGLAAKDGCQSNPAYWCYDPGLEPSTSIPFVIFGGVLILVGGLTHPAVRRSPLGSPVRRILLLVLAGGLVQAAVALYVFGNHNPGWSAAAYAPTLLIAGASLAAREVTPAPRRWSSPRVLVILAVLGVVLEFVYLWYLATSENLYFASFPAWASYLETALVLEAEYVTVSYGLLIWNLYLLRGGRSTAPRPAHRVRHRTAVVLLASLCVSTVVVFVMMAFWFVWMGGTGFPTPPIVVGASVHLVPFVAILLGFDSPELVRGVGRVA